MLVKSIKPNSKKDTDFLNIVFLLNKILIL